MNVEPDKKPTFFSCISWLGVALVLALPIFTLDGAVDMFLKIKEAPGESQDKEHENEIDVLAWSWGVSNSFDPVGGGTGKASVTDISITKYVDSATPKLLLYALNGDHFNDALLTVRKAGKTPLEYIKLEMKNVFVTSVSTGGSAGEDKLTENVSLAFTEFKLTYTPQKEDGSAGTPDSVEWDISKNEP